MTLKLFGAFLVIAGCGGFGFMIAAAHKKEVATLQKFIEAIEYISCELQYRLTPLPELCYQASKISCGVVGSFFSLLSVELNKQISPNAAKCVESVLSKELNIPKTTKELMSMLGSTLGLFDAQGQLNGLEAIKTQAQNRLQMCTLNQDTRLRSYQTLGLCAGAAMAILFI